ncbi:MAG: hypothetical protein ABIJ96_03895 [Elusimicrobiota bacterium]
MKNKRHLYWIGGTFAALLGLTYLSKSVPNQRAALSLAGHELRTLDGARTVDLGQCRTPRCVTIYVAPWCGICQRSTAFLNAVHKYLEARNIDTRIVVGRGNLENVKRYAPDFGPDALIDAEGKVPLQGGVPNFIVSTPTGEIIKTQAGVPGLYEPPFSESLMRQMSDFLGLS